MSLHLKFDFIGVAKIHTFLPSDQVFLYSYENLVILTSADQTSAVTPLDEIDFWRPQEFVFNDGRNPVHTAIFPESEAGLSERVTPSTIAKYSSPGDMVTTETAIALSDEKK